MMEGGLFLCPFFMSSLISTYKSSISWPLKEGFFCLASF